MTIPTLTQKTIRHDGSYFLSHRKPKMNITNESGVLHYCTSVAHACHVLEPLIGRVSPDNLNARHPKLEMRLRAARLQICFPSKRAFPLLAPWHECQPTDHLEREQNRQRGQSRDAESAPA